MEFGLVEFIFSSMKFFVVFLNYSLKENKILDATIAPSVMLSGKRFTHNRFLVCSAPVT